MPPVIIAVAMGATAGLAVVGTVGVVGAWAVGTLVAAASFAGTGQTPDTPTAASTGVGKVEAQGITLNRSGNTEPVQVVYGEREIGGSPILREVTGAENKRLHVLYVLGEGPIEKVENVYFNQQEVSVGEELGQQVVLDFVGSIDRWTLLEMRVVDDPDVGGTFSQAINEIGAIYADPDEGGGGYFREVAHDKDDGMSATITLNPWNINDLAADEDLTVKLTDKTNNYKTKYSIEQQPTRANGWIFRVRLHDKVSSIPSTNEFEFTLTKTGKTVDRSYSTASEVWPILGNQDLGNSYSAADEAILAKLENNLPGVWDSTKRLPNIAALYVIMDYDADVFSGIPTVTANIKGLKVFDPRSGATAYSNNPVLCARDYLTNTIYGRGVPASDIDDVTIAETANYCDEILDDHADKRYTCNGVVNVDATHMENFKRINTSYRGIPVWSAGKWQLLTDRQEIPTGFVFDEDNIIGRWKFYPPRKKNLFNEVTAKFFNPNESWQDDIEPVFSEELQAQDGGQVLKGEFSYPFTSARWRVNNLATMALNQSRYSATVELTATMSAEAVNVGDIVELTHPTPGYDQKPFRVVKLNIKSVGEVVVTLQEYDDNAYNYGVVTLEPSAPQSNLPNFRDLPPPAYIETETGTEYLQLMADGTVAARVRVIFGATPYANQYEVQYALNRLSLPEGIGSGAWSSIITSNTEVFLTDVVAGKFYDVRIRAISGTGNAGGWRDAAPVYVVGKEAKPSTPTNLKVVVHEGTGLSISVDAISDLDAAEYIFKHSFGFFNFIGKNDFSDGTDGLWTSGHAGHEDEVVDVPATHPLGRTKCYKQTNRDSYYLAPIAGNYYNTSAHGKTFRVTGYVYNASTVAANAGLRSVNISTVSTWATGAAAPANDNQWRYYNETFTVNDEDGTRMVPFLQCNGYLANGDTLEAYWTDMTLEDISSENTTVNLDAVIWENATEITRQKGTHYLWGSALTGDITLWVIATDTSNNYSDPVSQTITIEAPSQPSGSASYSDRTAILEWGASSGSFNVAHYVVSTADAPDVIVTDTRYAVLVNWQGSRVYTITAVDIAGNEGLAGAIEVNPAAPGVVDIKTEVIDNNVLFRYSATAGSLPIDRFELWKNDRNAENTTFEAANLYATKAGSSTFTTLFENAKGNYTYWLIAVDSAGNTSPPSAASAYVNQPPDYVLIANWESKDNAWGGTKVNALVTGINTMVVPVKTGRTWQQHFTDNGWNQPSDQISAGYNYFIQPSDDTATYSYEQDYGVAISGSLITLVVSYSEVSAASEVTITPLIEYYTGSEWVSGGLGNDQVFAQNFTKARFTITVAASGGDDLAEITNIELRLDKKIRTDIQKVQAVATDAGGTELTFQVDPPFIDVTNISVTPKSQQPVIAVYDFLDEPNPTGCKILLFDNNGNRINGECSVTIQGY